VAAAPAVGAVAAVVADAADPARVTAGADHSAAGLAPSPR